MAAVASVVIPAHDEAAVIGATWLRDESSRANPEVRT